MATEATSSHIRVSAQNTGLWNIVQDDSAARRTGDLLEKDLALHHVFLNRKGFHDHMLHHILALYGTGANAAQIQRAFDLRHDLQRPVEPRHEEVISDLSKSWDSAKKYLGNEDHYPDFLAYFQERIDRHGYEWVVKEHLLKGDASADDLLVRLHAGVLHPLIQLMYALEWKQPAVVAEALAQTCVHGIEGLDNLLLTSERRAKTEQRMPPILSLFEQIQADSNFEGAARFQDESKIEDGILKRALEPMLSILEQVHVTDDELEERTAEMFHTIILVASSAAIHPPYHVKYDFFLMHHVNSAIMYLTTLQQAWLSRRQKCRLLEWKIRMDLIQYVARGRTPISVEAIASYEPKLPSKSSVRDIGNRLHDFGDDGHGIKQARATALCHELMKNWEDKPWAILKGDSIWQRIQHMVVDALEVPGPLYARSAGYEEAWKDVPLHGTPRRPDEELRALQTGSGSSAAALASS
ncbi:Questin oxidase [Paramyrothecium foliicola]|nr:Questin oxidase [Paramyrothecium foliicola]